MFLTFVVLLAGKVKADVEMYKGTKDLQTTYVIEDVVDHQEMTVIVKCTR